MRRFLSGAAWRDEVAGFGPVGIRSTGERKEDDMNDALTRVLLHWGESRIYWFPFGGLRPARDRRMGWAPVAVHAFAGFFWLAIWFALAGRFIWPGRWSWELPFVPGLVGGIAGCCWAMMVRVAWNRRVTLGAPSESGASGKVPEAAALRPIERWFVQPAALVAVLALAVALVVGVENIRGHRALRSFEAELRAAGAPVTVAEIVPPPIPDERNLAMSPLFRPGLDYERPDPVVGGTIRWRDTNGWARLQSMLALEDPKRSFSAFVTERREPGTSRDRRIGWTDGLPVDLEAWRDYYASLEGWPKPSGPGGAGAAILCSQGGRALLRVCGARKDESVRADRVLGRALPGRLAGQRQLSVLQRAGRDGGS